jgi:predicted transcriptional regulator
MEVNLLAKHRGYLDILADIMKVAKESTSKTHIMFRANLSYKLLEKYLEIAISNGFISSDKSRYRLTSQGKVFLEEYNKYCDGLSKIQGMLKELNNGRASMERMHLKSNLERKNYAYRFELTSEKI